MFEAEVLPHVGEVVSDEAEEGVVALHHLPLDGIDLPLDDLRHFERMLRVHILDESVAHMVDIEHLVVVHSVVHLDSSGCLGSTGDQHHTGSGCLFAGFSIDFTVIDLIVLVSLDLIDTICADLRVDVTLG